LETQSTNWQAILEETRDKLIAEGQSTIANEVSNTLSRAISDVGIETRCSVDFLQDRIREDLIRIRAGLTHETLTLTPVFCNPTPSVIDMSLIPEQRLTHLEIDVYNLDVANIQVFLLDNQGRQTDITFALASPSQYLLTLNLGRNGVPLSTNSDKLIFKLPNETKTVNIIQPPQPTPTIPPIMITGLLFTYWTGDEDKDNDSGHVGAEVLLDGQILANGPTENANDPEAVWKDETTHGPYELMLSQPAPWSSITDITVAIWHRRDGGDPAWRFRVQIDAILSTGEKRRVLNYYDPERFFNHKPGDQKWWVFDLRGREGETLKTPFFSLGPK
jgi:hypothetical protein